MAQEKTYVSLSALAVLLATACSDKANNPPPQTPADQTTTTAAAENSQASEAMAGPSASNGTYPSSMSPQSTPSTVPSPIDSTAGTNASGSSPVAGIGTPSTGSTTADQPAELSDAEIVAVVRSADHGEIEQAREALRKAKSGRVKQFAQHMITDHSAADAKIARLDSKDDITPKESAVTAQLKSSGEQIMGNLRSSTGADFDKAYIDAQVTEHTQVLDLLDNKLIPHAQNADLTKTLQDVRTKVADHLKMAQDIQSSLANGTK